MTASAVDLTRTADPAWIRESYVPGADPRHSDSERHRWLCRVLAERRKATAEFHSQTAKQHYSALLACAVETTELPDGELPDGIEIVEVLSDGLGLLEPHWNAIRARDSSIDYFDENDLKKKSKKIRDLRLDAHKALGVYPRHRDMGRQLADSVVFRVTDSGSVMAYCPYRQTWVDVREEGAIRDLLVLEDGREQEHRDALRNSLFALSERALWPAFFENRGRGSQLLSLVLVATTPHSSFGSVWALHLRLPKRLELQLSETPNELLVMLTRTPESCLRDAWSLSHIRDFGGETRIDAVRLFRAFTARRREPLPTDLEPYPKSDIDLYESVDGMGPEATYGRAFDAACMDQLRADRLPSATETPAEILYRGTRSWTVGMALSRRGRLEEARAYQALARERIRSVAGPEALQGSTILWEKVRDSVGGSDNSWLPFLEEAFRVVGRYGRDLGEG